MVDKKPPAYDPSPPYSPLEWGKKGVAMEVQTPVANSLLDATFVRGRNTDLNQSDGYTCRRTRRV